MNARARDPFTTFTKPSISLITLSGILCLLNVHFRSDDLSVHSLYISFTTFTPYVPNGTHICIYSTPHSLRSFVSSHELHR